MMFCQSCCCCLTKKANIESDPNSEDKIKSRYKDKPVFVIDTETRTNQQPITVQPTSNFEVECLNEHNKYRAKHGCPSLKLNKELSKFAKEWAQYLANSNKFEHRSNSTYGENIYMASGKKVTGKEPVQNWYSEVKNYRYGGQDGFSSNSGHFTQVVWKNSKQLGVGYAEKDSSTYVVCNYDPAGNYRGEYLENVPAPR